MGNCPRAYRGLARARDNTLSSDAAGCVWKTGCLQKAEPRTLTDMTFLKFAAIYVSPVLLLLFYLPSLAFFFLVPATLASPPPLPLPLSFPPASDPQSSVFLFLAPLLFFSLLPPLDLAFSSFVLFHPLVATPTAYIASTSRGEREGGDGGEGKRSIFLSLSVSRRIVLLFPLGLRAFFERANEQDDLKNASFSKLKTGLSASTFGPTANKDGQAQSHVR